MPGAAEADSINTIIMGKGILNFRLVDSDASDKFNQYYAANAASTFNALGDLIDLQLFQRIAKLWGNTQRMTMVLMKELGTLL